MRPLACLHTPCFGSAVLMLSCTGTQNFEILLTCGPVCRDFQPNVISAVQAFAVALSTFDSKVLL